MHASIQLAHKPLFLCVVAIVALILSFELLCDGIELNVQLTKVYVASIFIGFGADSTHCINIAGAATDGTRQVQSI